MTLEEAMLRIQELETENASLKKKPRVQRDRFPAEIREKHPAFPAETGKLFAYESALSSIVRCLCFPGKTRLVKMRDMSSVPFHPRTILREEMGAIKLVEMTDAQYAKYLEAIDAILTALEPIRAEVFAAASEE